jgi:hypothetical protein
VAHEAQLPAELLQLARVSFCSGFSSAFSTEGIGGWSGGVLLGHDRAPDGYDETRIAPSAGLGFPAGAIAGYHRSGNRERG